MSAVGSLLAASPDVASAHQVTLNFDQTKAGTQLTNQYDSRGVEFMAGPAGPDQGGTPFVASESYAHSGSHDVELVCGEVCRADIALAFTTEQDYVSFYVASTAAPNYPITAVAYNSSGTPIDTVTETAFSRSFATQITLNAPIGGARQADLIAFVDIQPPDGVSEYAIDDLSFGYSGPPPPPDFGLVPQFPSGGIGVLAGGNPSPASLLLRRFDGSSGPIDWTYSGLPAGVSLTITPSPDPYGDQTGVNATFTATLGAPAATNVPVTITATPSSGAVGYIDRTVTVAVTVQTSYALRIQGIELTQGIQTFTLPTRNTANPSAPVPYSGVKLVSQGMPTLVRVYADAPGGGGGIQGATVTLAGYSANGQALPGSPLSTSVTPEEGTAPDTLTDSGSATVPVSERTNPAGSYDFTLPANWIAVLTSLIATITPPTPQLGQPSQGVVCTTPACNALTSFTLNHITSVDPGTTAIDVVGLTVNGKGPNPFTPFGWAERLMPANVFPDEDAGTIDIGWISQGCPVPQTGGGTMNYCPGRTGENAAALTTLEDFASNYDNGQGPALIGVTNLDLGLESGTFGSGKPIVGDTNEPTAVVNSNRPVTDVMHEIGHMFGLLHASQDCGGGGDNDSDDVGQHGEDWAPDQHGYIDGIGVDLQVAAPFAIVAGPTGPPHGGCSSGQTPPECGGSTPAQFFDFMSYCDAADPNTDGALGSTNSWISVRNWDYIATFASCTFAGGDQSSCLEQAYAAATADANAAAAQQANEAALLARPANGLTSATIATELSGPGKLRVYGYRYATSSVHALGHITAITMIDPTPSKRILSGTRSALRLALLGANNDVLTSVPMLASDIHVDGTGTLQKLEGAITQNTSAQAIAIMAAGKILAIRRRPAHKPTVSLLGPKTGVDIVASAPLTVSWNASEPGAAHLIASVDFSADGGKVWRTVFEGTSTGSAQIPHDLLSGTRSARVRVRINDLYQQVAATSGVFAVDAAPPRVTITSPMSGDQISPGASLVLSGTATDDAGASLTGSALTWLANTTVIGTGSPFPATLPPGTESISLIARDPQGRTTKVTIRAIH
jgi:hypothetical protein